MWVEARWTDFAAFLSEDTGQPRRIRDAYTGRALRLATEDDYQDMIAFARGRQSDWAGAARRKVARAEDVLRDSGVQRARLALACAEAGERDRAEVEGRKALAIARATRSNAAARELEQLGRSLSAN
jgi:hypothetical protein